MVGGLTSRAIQSITTPYYSVHGLYLRRDQNVLRKSPGSTVVMYCGVDPCLSECRPVINLSVFRGGLLRYGGGSQK